MSTGSVASQTRTEAGKIIGRRRPELGQGSFGFVARGGAHVLPALSCTASNRTGVLQPERGSSSTGFRLVRTITD